MSLCYISGAFSDISEAVLPVTDMVIQRGVGVFEVIAAFEGRPLMLTKHLDRLFFGAEKMRLRPRISAGEIADVVREGISRTGETAQVRIYLTGGDVFSERDGFTEPRFFAIFEHQTPPPDELYRRGAVLEPVAFGRDDPTVKGVDYSSSFVKDRGAFEVLYCPDGEITEAGHSSFFAVIGGKLVTAPLDRVLNGTTRSAVIEIARADGIDVEERCPLLAEIAAFEEAFITGSVKRILPVSRIGETPIDSGAPGRMTRRLTELYAEHIRKFLE